MSKKIHHLIITLLLFVGIGCGGGTRGSGGQLYDGFIGDESRKGLPGLSVTIVQSGDSAISDQDGRFTIQTTSLSGSLSLLIEGEAVSTTVETAEVPEDAVRIKVSITIPSSGTSGASATIEVKDRRQPTNPATSTPSDSGNDTTPSDSDGTSDDNNEDDTSDDDSSGSGSGSGGGNDDLGDSGGDNSDSDGGASGGSGGDSGNNAPKDGDKRDLAGTISSISGVSVTVMGLEFFVTNDSEFRDLEGKKGMLTDFNVGSPVRARGVYQSGKLLLDRLEAR